MLGEGARCGAPACLLPACCTRRAQSAAGVLCRMAERRRSMRLLARLPHLLHSRCTLLPPLLCPPRSGRVIRAELRGEVVAAKEVEVGRGLELQEAFIKEAQQASNPRVQPCCSTPRCAVPGRSGVERVFGGGGQAAQDAFACGQAAEPAPLLARAAKPPTPHPASHGTPAPTPQLCNLRHPNIVTFYGCCVRRGKGILLTELCEGEAGRSGRQGGAPATGQAACRRPASRRQGGGAAPAAAPAAAAASTAGPACSPTAGAHRAWRRGASPPTCAHACRPRPGVGASAGWRRRATRVWLVPARLQGGVRGGLPWLAISAGRLGQALVLAGPPSRV